MTAGIPATCIVRAAVDGWAAEELRTLTQNTALPPTAVHRPASAERAALSAGSRHVRERAAAARPGQPIPVHFVDDMSDVIAHDTFANSRLSALTEMALLERLWQSMASPANLSNIAADVDVTADTVTRHVGYLRDAFLLRGCPQRADDFWLPRDRAQDKPYAVDPVVARLAHLRNPERRDIDPTVLTEMQIGMAVRRRILADRPRSSTDESLFYVRTASRKEIDFVAADLAGVAVEAKYTEGGRWLREAQTVNASEWNGILAARDVLVTDGPGAWAVPAAFLAYAADT
ncbi:MAG: DUF4143 domain-containing protein [Actinobacteria bacterium]|nr:DUF4143 domain-containing protein [Actinomycetota bacterium]